MIKFHKHVVKLMKRHKLNVLWCGDGTMQFNFVLTKDALQVEEYQEGDLIDEYSVKL